MSDAPRSLGPPHGAPLDTRRLREELLKASPPLFPWRLLDALTRTYWLLPVLVHGPLVIVLAAIAAYRGLAQGALAALALLGYVLWTFTEYWLHRAVFHYDPKKGFWHKIHWVIHGVHHDHPNDPRRLVMPLAASIPAALGAAALSGYALGTSIGFAGSSGFIFGYLLYDVTHYWTHVHRPKSRLGRMLREHHMRHHFQEGEHAYCVSAPWLDLLFKTMPPERRRRPVE